MQLCSPAFYLVNFIILMIIKYVVNSTVLVLLVLSLVDYTCSKSIISSKDKIIFSMGWTVYFSRLTSLALTLKDQLIHICGIGF